MGFRSSISNNYKSLLTSMSIKLKEELNSCGVTHLDSMLENDITYVHNIFCIVLINTTNHSFPVRSRYAIAFRQIIRESTIGDL